VEATVEPYVVTQYLEAVAHERAVRGTVGLGKWNELVV